jgi:hypothetical protein
MRQLIFCFVLFLGLIFKVQAQYVPENNSKKDTTIIYPGSNKSQKSNSINEGGKKFDWSRVVPGGNFALSFGNPYYVDLSPMAGYMVSEKLMLGVGLTYIAFGGNGQFGRYDWSIYGGRILARRLLFDNIYGNVELESLNVPYYFRGSDLQRKWLTSPLIGGSYVFPFANRGGIQATLLYNLNFQEAYSPYPSALIWRMGLFF